MSEEIDWKAQAVGAHKLLVEQQSEIERLNALIAAWSQTGSRYEHKISGQKKLIAELAEVVSRHYYSTGPSFVDIPDLLQRAREAANE